MELYLVKTFNGFTTANGEDEKIKRFKIGQLVKCEITVPRNLGFHRKFMALLKIVFENQEIIPDFDTFREEVTIAAGFFYWTRNINGFQIKRAKSLKFSKMDDAEFQELYNSAIDVCLALIGGTDVDRDALEMEIISFL